MAEDGGEGSCSASNASTNGDGATNDEGGGPTTPNDSSTSQDTIQEQKNTCEDQHEKCQIWADVGECAANPSWMHTNCQRACELCADQR